ncbi:unnamed protein product [Psylliodes chrysocephalus]|uniref:Uncharacterized protein n=1 Tax=Psylliodes chrysocephalus TaxID=3402493 RepID=A0A9P0CY21_9CUCU|nr:unnamed protein product [Psylliodes chrysocephala]
MLNKWRKSWAKKNIRPEILLSSTTIDEISDERFDGPSNNQENKIPVLIPNEKHKTKKASKILVNRNAILDEIRKDRKEYQSKRLKIEGEKIEIQKQKVKEIKRRNDLLAERNDLIKTLTASGESSFTSLL